MFPFLIAPEIPAIESTLTETCTIAFLEHAERLDKISNSIPVRHLLQPAELCLLDG